MGRLDRHAVKWCSNHIGPDLIPLSGREAEKNDFYSVYLCNSELGEGVFVVKSVKSDTIDGVVHFPDRSIKPQSFCIGFIDKSQIQIMYYYHGHVFTYLSGLSFFLNKFFFTPKLMSIFLRIREKRLKNRILHISNKAQLLETIIANANAWRYGFDNLNLFEKIYSLESIRSDGAEEVLHFQKMVLDSLVETGELKIRGNRYELNPKAFSSLLDWRREAELQERAHNNQKALNRLTLLVVIATFTSAFSHDVRKAVGCVFGFFGNMMRFLLSL